MDSILAPALGHVYWIGGSPCSGKSSVTAALADEFGFAAYSCDDAFYRHREIIDAEHHPVFHRLSQATCDELWMRPVEQQVSEEITIYDEEFSLILDDLRAMPDDRPVTAEGADIMPHLLHDSGVPRHRAIWLVPSPGFQREHYARRDWRHTELAGCTDPNAAWVNWMERDIGFARFVDHEAMALDRTCIVVDGARSLDENLGQVRAHFRLHEIASTLS